MNRLVAAVALAAAASAVLARARCRRRPVPPRPPLHLVGRDPVERGLLAELRHNSRDYRTARDPRDPLPGTRCRS